MTREYFATDNGRLVRLAPTSQPAESERRHELWQHDAERSLQSRFCPLPKTNHDTGPVFSEAGFAGYVNALQASNILDTIKRRNLTSQPLSGQVPGQSGDRWRTASGSGNSSIRSGCLVGQTSTRPEQAFTFEITVRRVDHESNPAAWKSARWFPVTPQQESETHIMHIHHLIGALLIVCGTVTAADNPGWKNARTRRPAERPHRQPGTPRQAVPASRTTPRKPAASRRCSCYRKAHRWILP